MSDPHAPQAKPDLSWLVLGAAAACAAVTALARSDGRFATAGPLAPWIPLSAPLLTACFFWLQRNRARAELRRMRGRLKSREDEIAALGAIGRRIAATTDPRTVLETLERECRKAFPADGCVIAILEGAAAELEVVFSRSRRLRVPPAGTVLPAPLARWLLERPPAARIDDTREDRAGGPPLAGWIDAPCRSALVAPLLVGGRVIGMVALESRTPRAYDGDRIDAFTTLVQQAAVAVQNARNYELATRDSLTRFYVRDHFLARLEEESTRVLRYGGSFAVLMVDLDDFKRVNDLHGHLAGDRFLQEITTTIRHELRSVDVPCRYGGDEFCLLLPETDVAGARAIAERIRSAVAGRTVLLDGRSVKTTASIGLAIFPDGAARDARASMRCADEALYRAKRLGRDRVEVDAA
jgi:diguanylate cyclase (GGDEF)-like protein